MILMWRVQLSPDVQQFLQKQDQQLVERLRKGLEKLKTENPFHFLEHFEGKDFYIEKVKNNRTLFFSF